MRDRPRSTAIDWTALFVGVIGSLGGIIISAWFLVASSHGGGEAVADFSEAELKAYSIAMLVLFFVALLATLRGLKTPRASGLTLIVTGGLSLVLAVYGTVVWLGGGLLLVPFGFLALVAGVVLVTRGEAKAATP